MKPLLLLFALLSAGPALAQSAPKLPTPSAAGEAPTMLADLTDELETAKLKLLRKKAVALPPPAEGAAPGTLTFTTAEGLRIPQGRLADLTWQGQPITAYTVEAYGGGPHQKTYPEGQIFYAYTTERAAGLYVYMNVPRRK